MRLEKRLVGEGEGSWCGRPGGGSDEDGESKGRRMRNDYLLLSHVVGLRREFLPLC